MKKQLKPFFCHNSTTSLFKIISEVDFVTISDLYVLGFFSKYYANEVRQLTTNFNIRVHVIQIHFLNCVLFRHIYFICTKIALNDENTTRVSEQKSIGNTQVYFLKHIEPYFHTDYATKTNMSYPILSDGRYEDYHKFSFFKVYGSILV